MITTYTYKITERSKKNYVFAEFCFDLSVVQIIAFTGKDQCKYLITNTSDVMNKDGDDGKESTFKITTWL